MKKYNLSKIMKRAWELVKKAGMTISSGLKKSWEEAKMTISKIVKFNVTGNETFTVDTATGEFSGKTDLENDEIIDRELVNKWDGFYARNIHKSGKISWSFIG